jgi:uncharacterized protein (DUF2141 family)
MRIVLIGALLFGCHGTPDGKPQPFVAEVSKGSGAVVDQITVNVSALRSDEGTVRCFLYNDGADFPDSATHVIAKAVALPADRAGACVFAGVAPNRDYAIVILHDENNDNVFQKNALGIPQEGYGFSNNAKARFSAPSYDDCKFHFGTGALAIAIAMQY